LAQKTHETPIDTLSIAAPLGVNAMKSGKISRELVLAGNSGYRCYLLTSSLIRVVHIGDISKLGWLIGSFAAAMWAASLYFLHIILASTCRTVASFQQTRCPSYACWANLDLSPEDGDRASL
jgi:hypothetical protein